MVTYHFHSSPLLTMITIIVSRISPASVDVNTQYNRPFTTVARHITNMACMMKRSRVKIALKMLHFEAIASRKQSEVTLKDPPSSGQISFQPTEVPKTFDLMKSGVYDYIRMLL